MSIKKPYVSVATVAAERRQKLLDSRKQGASRVKVESSSDGLAEMRLRKTVEARAATEKRTLALAAQRTVSADKRSYVSEGCIAIIIHGKDSATRPFLATSGLATCVGLFVYVGPGMVLAAHFDQPQVSAEVIAAKTRQQLEVFLSFFKMHVQRCGYQLANKPSARVVSTANDALTVAQAAAITETCASWSLNPVAKREGNDWALNILTGDIGTYTEREKAVASTLPAEAKVNLNYLYTDYTYSFIGPLDVRPRI